MVVALAVVKAVAAKVVAAMEEGKAVATVAAAKVVAEKAVGAHPRHARALAC